MSMQLGKLKCESSGGPSLIIFYLPFLVIVAAYCVGRFLPGRATWGVDIWSVLPVWVVGALAGLYLVASIPAISDRLYDLIEHLSTSVRSILAHLPSGVRAGLISLGLLVLLYLLRSHALVYGDGFLVRDRAAVPLLSPFADVHEYSKPITIFVYRIGHLLFSEFGKMDAGQSFSLTSSILGVAGLWALWHLSALLFSDVVRRRIVLWGALSSSCLVLFFGYVEQYTPGTVALLWSLVALVKFYDHRLSYGRLLLMVLLTLGCNLLTATVAAMLLLKPKPKSHKNPVGLEFAFGLRTRGILLLAAILSIAAALLMQFSPRVGLFVPIWPKSQSTYWSLSVDHLLDVANLIAHVAPVGILAYLAAKWSRHLVSPRIQLVAVVAWLLLITCFWLDPMLGAARDWDLLSMFGFPLTLAGIAALVECSVSPRVGKILTVQCLLAALLLVGPNLYEKYHQEKATERLDRILRDSPQYQVSYRNGRDLNAWVTVLCNETKRTDLAKRYCYRILEAKPYEPQALNNLGNIYLANHQLDSAVHYYRTLHQLLPEMPHVQRLLDSTLELAQRTFDANNPSDLKDRVISNPVSFRSRGIALARQGDFEGALDMFRHAYTSNPDNLRANVNLAQIYLFTGQSDSAVFYFRRALEFGPGRMECVLRSNILRLLLQKGDTLAASGEFQQYALRCNQEPDIDSFKIVFDMAED